MTRSAFCGAFLLSCLVLGAAACLPPEQRLVRSLAQAQLWLEAEARLQQQLRQNPDSAELHNNLAVCYEALGRRDQALREYRRALELAPEHAVIRSNLEAAERLAVDLLSTPAAGAAP